MHPNSRASAVYNRYEFLPMDDYTSNQIRDISKDLSEILRIPLILIQMLLVVGYQCQRIYEQMLYDLDNKAEQAVKQEERWQQLRDKIYRDKEEEAARGKKRCLHESKKDATEKKAKKARKESCQITVPQTKKREYPTR